VWDLIFWQQFSGMWHVIVGWAVHIALLCLHLQGQHSERNSVSVIVLVYLSLNFRITRHVEMVLLNMIKVYWMAHEDFSCYTVQPCRKCRFWPEAATASDQSPYQSLTQCSEIRRGSSVAGRPSRPSAHSWVCCSTAMQFCELSFEQK